MPQGADVAGRVVGHPVRKRLEVELQADAWQAYTDGHQLENALLNLVINARDAMPDGGTVTLELTTRDGRAHIAFSDTGEGMDEQVRRRVFEPFYTTKTRLKGTGLGLALVHGILENHAGTVTLDSTPGQGTTVTIDLPLTPVPAAPLEPRRPQAPAQLSPASEASTT